ncbi:protein adenylyltransferase SelO [Rickettsiales endosymbiont of Stachyamoeba lipophora]|uniref:protein adenylyltransferase SelO n=1 Tax=Rickettsiales endosymbiont of Stachyamoeba lipophora TaxID=2486578 RepID=UPI000F6502CC|nr:YdiU family protein [Rickettsiales endosymbiont of Stachyamoeba lipophora]AZL16252.1 YdiU family protein [Rickettsiales endosymbiont of Stachyamoeba lipophora]
MPNYNLNNLPFDNKFAGLPAYFFTKMSAEKFSRQPFLIHANFDAATMLNLDHSSLNNKECLQFFTGHSKLPGSDPLAMVYAGHQFGHYVPQLGDGRALLLGQVRNDLGKLIDIQLKGSGKTPYSRFGDGRAVMRSSIREYLCSEAMHALGVPTTRALFLIATNEEVQREKLEPGCILTRLSDASHIRFGHFEYFYNNGLDEAVKVLADHVISEYYPHLIDKPNKYSMWFSEVVKRTAILIAKWQSVGYAHGVMNTDNMSITGLTIDYGPFGFMEHYDEGLICNHSDTSGRYAFNQQPYIGAWNLYMLAHSLQDLISFKEAEEIIKSYAIELLNQYNEMMLQKLGFNNKNLETISTSKILLTELLEIMQEASADYTLAFRYLSEVDKAYENSNWLNLFGNSDKANIWLKSYLEHLKSFESNAAVRKEQMNQINPKFILRNWIAEEAIRAAEDKKDYTIINTILKIMHNPFDEHKEYEYYASTAPKHLQNLSISCSS